MLCSALGTFSYNECHTWKLNLIVWEGKARGGKTSCLQKFPVFRPACADSQSAGVGYSHWRPARGRFCTCSICPSQHRCLLRLPHFPPVGAPYAWTVQTLSFCWGSRLRRQTMNKNKQLPALMTAIKTKGQLSTLIFLFYFSLIYLRVCVDVMGYARVH